MHLKDHWQRFRIWKRRLSNQIGLDATTEFLETSNINTISYSIEDNVKNLKDIEADLQEEADELEKESENTQSPARLKKLEIDYLKLTPS